MIEWFGRHLERKITDIVSQCCCPVVAGRGKKIIIALGLDGIKSFELQTD